jgi:hypothetical protein
MTQAPGWYTDPTGSYSYRYWDGSGWTSQVSSGGTSGTDPNPMAADVAATPPAPGTAAQGQPAVPQPAVQVTQSTGRSSFGTVVAIIIGVIAIIIVIVLLGNSSSDDDSTSTTEPPATTEAPAEG